MFTSIETDIIIEKALKLDIYSIHLLYFVMPMTLIPLGSFDVSQTKLSRHSMADPSHSHYASLAYGNRIYEEMVLRTTKFKHTFLLYPDISFIIILSRSAHQSFCHESPDGSVSCFGGCPPVQRNTWLYTLISDGISIRCWDDVHVFINSLWYNDAIWRHGFR